MTFFPEPLKPSEGRQEDRFRVDPIEPDKHAKEGGGNWQISEEKKKSALYGSFLIIISKFTRFFTHNEGDTLETASQNEMVTGMQQLREIIEHLKDGDQSGNSKLCQKFSEVWHLLSQGLELILRTKRQAYIDITKLQHLINDMNHYPPREEHKLGFYLSEYAGDSWLPLPFRDILKELHINHRMSSDKSVLNKWSDLITEILRG